MEYIKEDVENMLKEHLRNQAKLTEIEIKKEHYLTSLEYAGTVYEDEEKETIESMQLQRTRFFKSS